MPLTPDAVSHLQAAGHDAVHASSVGLAQATDRDYPRLVLLSDAAAPGLVLFRGGSYSDSEMLALPARIMREHGRHPHPSTVGLIGNTLDRDDG
jgi:hypothetical protein